MTHRRPRGAASGNSGCGRGPAGGTGTLLASTDPPHAIELWRWDLRPGEVRESSAHATGVRELINVESGVLRITVDDDVHRVPAGSSAVMPGDRRHSYAAEGSRAALLVLAVLGTSRRRRSRPEQAHGLGDDHGE